MAVPLPPTNKELNMLLKYCDGTKSELKECPYIEDCRICVDVTTFADIALRRMVYTCGCHKDGECLRDERKLPTKEEYHGVISTFTNGLSKPLYQCPKCCGNVRQDRNICYTSYPPKYRYVCDDCGYEEIW